MEQSNENVEVITAETLEQQSLAQEDPFPATNLSAELKGALVKFVVSFKKQNYDIEFAPTQTLGALRQQVAQLTGVAAGLQKLMFKGMLKDDNKTLDELGIKSGTRIMLVGSTIDQVMAASSPPQTEAAKFEEEKKTEPLSEQLPHKKVIDKGLPEGAEPALKGRHEKLPDTPLPAILNNLGIRIRLTFKIWSQELWIQSASSTQKLPFSSIRAVTAEPIKGKEEYYIMGLQLGSSERNKYYLYWVPCQYVRAIKAALTADYLGGYQP